MHAAIPSSPSSSIPPLYPDHAVLLAPLCDFTDYPFRQACRACGCQYAFTELVDAGSLYHHCVKGENLLHRGPDEPWLGVQVLGGRPDYLDEAVRQINDRDFQVLDFNLGCPMPKVTRRGCGAALGFDLVQTQICLEAIIKRSRFPVTAKMRILDETDPDSTIRLAQALERGGIQALTIHGRVWKKIYSGPVFSPVIAAVRRELRIPVIANGGIFSAADAAQLRTESGCSRLMVARGAIGNPWLFHALAVDDSAKDAAAMPTQAQLCAVLEAHILGMIELYGIENGFKCARKVILSYLKGRGYHHTLKECVCRIATHEEFAAFMTQLRQERPDGNQPVPKILNPRTGLGFSGEDSH